MRIFFCVLLVGVFSCKGEKDIPTDVLSPAKMEAVLYDLIKADEVVNFKALEDSTYQKLSRRTGLYDTVFAIHAIKKELFKKSLQFYQNHPDLLKPMFESLQKKAETITNGDTVKANPVDTNSKRKTHRPFIPIKRR